ncbi:MAG: AMP-binding protein [Candidatus Nomurabacteria bacterium]|jgi:long-chain acyl-CoA synthetase|nr:AMP-binding protein [Candidatus Nomurabacteria bacterium]
MSAKKVAAPWLKQYGKKRKKTLKYPKGSMYDEVLKTAEKYPDAMIYNYFGNKVNYATFMAEVDRAAHGFISLGVKKGDAISICSANIPEAITAIYAINKIGAVANIFHPLSAPNEIKECLNLVGSRILVVIDVAWPNVKPILKDTAVERAIILSPADSLPMLSKMGYRFFNNFFNLKEVQKNLMQILTKEKHTMNWAELLSRGQYVVGSAYEKMTASDVAAIMYSGGTTGKSKGIALSNYAFNATAVQCREAFPEVVRPGYNLLGIMPIFHGFGLGVGIHTIFCGGGGTIMLPKFDAKRFHSILSNTKPNLVVGVPTLFEAMIKDKKIRKLDLSFLKVTISGGDSMAPTLMKEVNNLLAKNGSEAFILQGYGLTECLSVTCVNLAESNRDGSIGLPVPDAFFKIVEPDTYIERKTGEIGEIVISAPSVMKGYVNNEVETNEALQVHPDGRIWLHTGDIGYMDKDGYVFFAQRLKRMIISSGYNIYPNEVEDVIAKVPSVLLSTVVGVDDKYRGQVAKAFVVLKGRTKPSDKIKEEIMEHCRQNLAKYKWPRSIEFRKTLPKTKVGKVAYMELTED